MVLGWVLWGWDGGLEFVELYRMMGASDLFHFEVKLEGDGTKDVPNTIHIMIASATFDDW